MFLSKAIFRRLVECASFLDFRAAGILNTAESLALLTLVAEGAFSEAVMFWNPENDAPSVAPPADVNAEASARVSADRMPNEDCSRAADCSWLSKL